MDVEPADGEEKAEEQFLVLRQPQVAGVVLVEGEDDGDLVTPSEELLPAGPLGASEITLPRGVTLAVDRLTGRALAASVEDPDELLGQHRASAPVQLEERDDRWFLTYRQDLVDSPSIHMRDAAVTLDLAFDIPTVPDEVRAIASIEALAQLLLVTPPEAAEEVQFIYRHHLRAVREASASGFAPPADWEGYWPSNSVEVDRLEALSGFVLGDAGNRSEEVERQLRAPAGPGTGPVRGAPGAALVTPTSVMLRDRGVQIAVRGAGGPRLTASVELVASELEGKPVLVVVEAGDGAGVATFVPALGPGAELQLHGYMPTLPDRLRVVGAQEEQPESWRQLGAAHQRRRAAARAWLNAATAGIGDIWMAAERSVLEGRFDQALAAFELGRHLRPADRIWSGVATDMRAALSRGILPPGLRYGQEFAYEVPDETALEPPRLVWPRLESQLIVGHGEPRWVI